MQRVGKADTLGVVLGAGSLLPRSGRGLSIDAATGGQDVGISGHGDPKVEAGRVHCQLTQTSAALKSSSSDRWIIWQASRTVLFGRKIIASLKSGISPLRFVYIRRRSRNTQICSTK